MTVLSEVKADYPGPFECVCCYKKVEHGGFYFGGNNIVLCSDCALRGDFRALGIAIGDAILDAYKRGHKADMQHTNTVVQDVLRRLESSIYRALAAGLYNMNISGAR